MLQFDIRSICVSGCWALRILAGNCTAIIFDSYQLLAIFYFCFKLNYSINHMDVHEVALVRRVFNIQLGCIKLCLYASYLNKTVQCIRIKLIFGFSPYCFVPHHIGMKIIFWTIPKRTNSLRKRTHTLTIVHIPPVKFN